MTGRKPGNLSRTLKTMSNYGIVEMKRENNHVRPIVTVTDFHIVAA
jgi:predicted transcriptional regulator